MIPRLPEVQAPENASPVEPLATPAAAPEMPGLEPQPAVVQEPAPEPIPARPVVKSAPVPKIEDLPGLEPEALDFLMKDSIDQDYLKLQQQREDDEAEKWLMDYARERGVPEAMEPDPEPEPPPPNPTLAIAAQKLSRGPAAGMLGADFEGMSKTILGVAGSVAGDVATGLTSDAANIVLGGPMRAVRSALNGIDAVATWLNQNVADLRVDLDKVAAGKGVTPDQPPKQGQDSSVTGSSVPNIGGVMDKPKSITGGIGQGITQFITGFAAGGKLLGMAAPTTAAGATAQTMLKGAFSDFAAFDGHEANLATLVQQFPQLKNPVTAYLAHEDADDSELEKRLQNVVAGAIPNAVFDGFLHGLRAIKAARKAKALAGGDDATYQEVAERIARGGPSDPTAGTPEAIGKKVQDLLGKPDAPDVVIKEVPPPLPKTTVDEIASRIEVMKTGIPDHVTAKYMYEQATKGDYAPRPPVSRAGEYRHMGPPEGPPPVPVQPYGVEYTGVHLDEPAQELLMMALVNRTKAFQEAFDAGVEKAAPRFFGKAKVDGTKFRELVQAYRQAEIKLQRKFGKLQTEAFLRQIEEGMQLRPTDPKRLQGYTPPSYAQMKWYIRQRFTDPTQPVGPSNVGVPPRTPPPPGQPPEPTPRGPFNSEVYVNWSKIETPDDIKRLMGQMVDADPAAIAAAQRGVRSNKLTAEAADIEDAWKLLVGERKEGAAKILSAEEQFALRKLWTSAGNKLMDLARAAQEGGPEELFAFRRMMSIYDLIQKEVIGIRTETARALQQWRMPAGGPTEIMKQIDTALTMSGGDAVSRKVAEAIVSAGEIGGRRAVDEMIKNTWRARTTESIREIWINAILSGPKTHMVNMLSNSAVLQQSIVERAVAGRFGSVFNPVDGVRQGEALAMMYGIRHSWRDAFRLAGKAFKSGETGHGMGKIDMPRVRALSAEKMGVASDTWMGKGLDALGGFVNVPGRALGAADEFFKTINYRAELYALAYRTASEEVDRGLLSVSKLKQRMIEIVANPPENMRLLAQNFAQYNTFTNDPGEFTKAIMKIRQTVDAKSESAFGVPSASFVIPFINTPANIFSYTFERTPIAPIMGRFKADIAAGGARANLAYSKLALGSAMVMTAYDLAMDGHVTGSGPSGDQGWRKKAAMRRGGWQPYSVRVQTGTNPDGSAQYRWFAYNRLDPMGAMIGLAADVADYARNHNDGVDQEAVEAVAAMTFAAAENLMSKSYMQGFGQFVEALHNPDRRGESYLTKIASSFVPTGVKEIKQMMDPAARQTTNLVDSIKARLPGMSGDVPPRLNFWGQPIEYTSGLGTAYDVLSPIYSSSNAKAEPIDREFMKLNYFPSHAGHVRLDGRNVTLRNMPAARNRLVELTSATKASRLADDNLPDMMTKSGRMSSNLRRLYSYGDRTMKQALNDLIAGKLGQESLAYETADTDEKVNIIQDVIRAYRKAATSQVIREFPRIKQIRAAIPDRDAKGESAPF